MTEEQAQEYRTEHDTMGEVQVPAKALWAAQTQRAVENFPISGRPIEPAQIRALGLVKGACARANKDLGVLDAEIADAVAAAADEVASGAHDGEFPIDVFQTGSGTSSNMNATRSSRRWPRARRVTRSTRTTTSTPRRARTTCSRRRSTSPPPRRSCATPSPRSTTSAPCSTARPRTGSTS